MALQNQADSIIILVEMMIMGQSDLGCFVEGEATIGNLKHRFFPSGRLLNHTEATAYIDRLIAESVDNWRTIMYDQIQFCCQGIVWLVSETYLSFKFY